MAIRPIDDANVVTPRGSIVGPDFNTYVSGGVFSGPLIKPQYTNFMLWSEDLTNSAWTKSGFDSTSQQTGITGQSFTEATQLTTTTTSGLVFQSMPSSAMITGGCYQLTAWMKLISGNSNVQFGVGGQYIQKTSGVVLTSSWQQVNIYTLVGRDATQTVGDPRASGNIYGAYFYIPSGTVVQISGVQMTLGNFVEPYVKTTSTYGRVAPRYETGCMYVSRRERNYLQESNLNNITSYWLNALSGFGSGVSNSTSSADSPIGSKSISRIRNNNTSAAGRGVIKNMPFSATAVGIGKPFHLAATVAAKEINSLSLEWFSDASAYGSYFALDSIDGIINSISSTGYIKKLGDSWSTICSIPDPAAPDKINLDSASAFNFGPRAIIIKDSSNSYANSFTGQPDDLNIANLQILDTYNIPSFFVTGNASGEVSGDIVTIGPESVWSYPSGTLMIDFYVDEYFGIASTGDDRYIRTILDLAETETRNRIRLFKNKPSHSYGIEVINQAGVSASGGFSLTLPIGWHRAQIDYTQSGVTGYINGVQRLTVAYSGGRNAGSVVNIGSNRFNTWENYGGYLKNFYAFDQIVLSSLSSDSQTRNSTYKSSESVTIVDQIGGEALKNPALYWINTSGATKAVTGGIADPAGGFNAYRVRISGGASTVKQTFITKFNFLRQQVNYRTNVWFRFISNTGSTASFSLNGLGLVNFQGLANWTNLTFDNSTVVGGNVSGVSQMMLITNDTSGAGIVEFEIYDPEFRLTYTRSRDVFTPNNEIDIPISTSSLRFKHRLGSEYNYGIVGTFESEVLDTGATRPNAKYIAKEIVDSIPSGSSISYEFAASDSQSGPFTFSSNLSQIAGRYIKAKATIYANNVADGYLTITSVKLIPESKSS